MKFEINNSGVLENIMIENEFDQIAVIPKHVTSIVNAVFEGCDCLTSVTIPDGVKSIGSEAFCGCSSLTEVEIPDSVIGIGHCAFRNCTSLTKIVIPDSVTEIVEGAFANCYSLENITLSQNLKQIEEYTFNCCNSLKIIALPASLAQINETAFDRCCALEKYIVDSKNNRYYDIDGVLFDRYTNMLLRYPEGKTNCEYIIPEDINQLGNVAFAGCGMLKNIRFPASLKKISNYSFVECTSLEYIFVNEHNPNFYDIDGILFDKAGTLLVYPSAKKETAYVVPKQTRQISACAFDSCRFLENVTLPEGLSVVPKEIFFKCSNLKSVYIPEGVTEIQDKAFSHCSALQDLILPVSLKRLGENIFAACNKLKNISVKKENECFCDKNGVLFDKKVQTLLWYPSDKTDTEYSIPIGVENISKGIFSNCGSLRKVVVPENITEIPEYAFLNCKNLECIVLPRSVSDIAYSALSIQRNDTDLSEKYSYFPIRGLTICAPKGSYSETYARSNQLSFIAL